MKVDGSISSLIQGVSQQPARERRPGQCELQVNFSSDPVNGLTRRGPIEFVKSLVDDATTYRWERYNAGSIGDFIIAHKAGAIKVFDLDGTEYTVTINSGGSYLQNSEMLFFGIDDKIYVVDPDKVTAMSSDTKDYVEDGCIVFLLGGQYGRDYEITLTWENAAGTEFTQTVTVTTPNGGTTSDIVDIATDEIATDLETALDGNATIAADFDIERQSDVLYIKKKSAADVATYRVEVSDGDGGANMFAVNNEVDDVGHLPRFAPMGYVVNVTESGEIADDWYLQFVVSPDANGNQPAVGAGFGRNGYWAECVAPGIKYKVDAATMPHILEKTGTTTFDYGEATWAERAAGDDTTNPVPSFIGETIRDLGAFQGRLVFLSDVNCIMSRSNNKHTNFFNQSATVLADDDPIDIASNIGTYVLKRLVPHNRDLVIFSDNAQFIVFGRNALTPRNSSLVLTTEFEADLRARPVGAGRNVFFPFKYGAFEGIQEFFTEGGEDINDSRSITQHVLQYIEGVPLQLVSTTNFNKLIVRTDDDKKKVYVYEYVWLDRQKAQASWSTWTFPRDIEHMFFADNLLYMITNDSTHYELFTLNLDSVNDSGVTYRAFLDEKIERTSVNTTFTVPYSIDDIDNYVVVQGTGCPNPGLRVPIESFSDPTVTLNTDMNGGAVYFGKRFTSRYIPTAPFVRDRDGVKIGSGKLTIKTYVLHFEETGFIKAVITDDHGYSAETEYQGRVVGAPSNLVGKPAISDGSYRVPFKKNAETSQLEIQSDSHTPLNLLEMEWLGQWRKKGKRITGG